MFQAVDKFPCPCCGYRVHRLPPGFGGVCPICGWEDDLAQLRFPEMPGGANRVSLETGQRNFQEFGAAERNSRKEVRSPLPGEPRDREWRVLDLQKDNPEQPGRGVDYANSYPEDTTILYYWRETYWQRVAG